ncbi:hypothetical protein [Pyrodictium abyssi]|uniref:Uncharacterized protein n=1 Tax=Pyrodictium abyssi TaxID=54256 RepID=A0ABM8IVF3_9CREN|nr:hypothetical protein PABY_11010 [Pyrodictium abyssi]
MNSLRIDAVRDRIIRSVANAVYDTVVKSQVVNEILYRVDRELAARGVDGIILFDADANNLINSTYSIVGSAISQSTGAITKHGTVKLSRIAEIFLGDSKLILGIQFADLLA